MSTLITESGDIIVQESVPGITGASTLNDTHVEVLYSDDISIAPLTNGWLIGSGWAWSDTNDNFEVV